MSDPTAQSEMARLLGVIQDLQSELSAIQTSHNILANRHQSLREECHVLRAENASLSQRVAELIYRGSRQ